MLITMVAVELQALRLQELRDDLRQRALGAEPLEVRVPAEAIRLRHELPGPLRLPLVVAALCQETAALPVGHERLRLRGEVPDEGEEVPGEEIERAYYSEKV